jgi:MFS family permease
VEEEDARVCKDIPEEACTDVPRNFFKLGVAQTLTKLADELTSAKTVLPWLLTSLGAPSFWIGLLVPIRESGSLLPQMAIGAAVRRRPRRKEIWVLGGMLQSAALLLMAVGALVFRGWQAGIALVGLLVLLSLARGLCSVASKDVIGKTVPKTRRGRLAGYTTLVAGLLTLALAAALTAAMAGDLSPPLLSLILGLSALLWMAASLVFGGVQETPGATEGGKVGMRDALQRLSLLRTDAPFRRFVAVRALLVSTALAGPFYVMLARHYSGGADLLAFFLLASGLAAALSSVLWGRYADRSSRSVLVTGAAMASALGVMVFLADLSGAMGNHPWIAPLAFFILAVAHSGVRIGRKTFILDLAIGSPHPSIGTRRNAPCALVPGGPRRPGGQGPP